MRRFGILLLLLFFALGPAFGDAPHPPPERGEGRKDSADNQGGSSPSSPLVFDSINGKWKAVVVHTDWIVVNRIRMVESEFVPNRNTPGWSERFVKVECYSSYISFIRFVPIPLGAPIPTIQGWWSFHPESYIGNPVTGEYVRCIEFVTDANGVSVINRIPMEKLEIVVVAKKLVVIDSTFDWEVRLRHRSLPCPKSWRIPSNAIEAMQAKR